MPIFDFVCQSCGDKQEQLVPKYVEEQACVGCGGTAKVQVSCPNFKLDGTDPSFPTAWNSWPKKREQKMKQEAKQES